MVLRGRLIKLFYNYRNGKLDLNCVIRTVDGVKVRRRVPAPFRPYFFVAKEYLSEVKKVVKKYCPNPSYMEANDCVSVDDPEVDLVKVEVNNPKNVGKIRRDLHLKCRVEGCKEKFKEFPSLMKHAKHNHGLLWEEYEKKYLIKIYEADIPFARRVKIDLGIRSGIKITDDNQMLPVEVDVPPKLLPWDIETDDRGKRIDMENKRIISIAAGDRWFCDEDESKILEEFQEYAKEYDYLYGHNIDKFDIPYFRKRCEVNDVDYVLWRWCQFIDQKIIWEKSHDRQIPSDLDYLVVTILHRNRVQVENFWDAFNNNRELLKKRNLDCVRSVEEINKEIRLIDGSIELADFVGLRTDRSVYPAVVAETAVMRKAVTKKPRPVFRCRIREKIGKKYKGALVIQPVMGLHENVAKLDFKRQYPRIVRTFNTGVDTLDPNGDIESPYARFTSKRRSIFAEVIAEVEGERDHYEELRDKSPFGSSEYFKYDLLQRVRKSVLLVLYGVAGEPKGRFYNKPTAESITYFGRFFLEETAEKVNGLEIMGVKCKPIYGDTDSVFIKFEPTPMFDKLLAVMPRLESILNMYYCSVLEAMGIPKDRWLIEIRLETVYDRFLLGDVKKRYYGHVVRKHGRRVDEVDVAGFELVRGDWCLLAREFQEELLRKVVIERADPKELLEYADAVKRLLYNREIPIEKLILSKGLGKEISEYKVDQPHVRAAKKIASEGYDIPGRVSYLVTAFRGKMIVEPIIGDKIPRIQDSGLDYYWNHQLQPLLDRILYYIGFTKRKKPKRRRARRVSGRQRTLRDYKEFKKIAESLDRLHEKMVRLYGPKS